MSNSEWATSRRAADYLGVSERTLHRWRASGLLKAAVHYRRKYPSANSAILYKLTLCEHAMCEAFARDHRILESVHE